MGSPKGGHLHSRGGPDAKKNTNSVNPRGHFRQCDGSEQDSHAHRDGRDEQPNLPWNAGSSCLAAK